MKVSLTKLAESSGHSKLVRAVVRQSGGWEMFKENARDICRHGIDGGFHGWIYYRETVPFAERYITEILVLAGEWSQSTGIPLGQMIANLSCIKALDISETELLLYLLYLIVEKFVRKPEEHDRVMNCLAWFAAEEVCGMYCDLLDQ